MFVMQSNKQATIFPVCKKTSVDVTLIDLSLYEGIPSEWSSVLTEYINPSDTTIYLVDFGEPIRQTEKDEYLDDPLVEEAKKFQLTIVSGVGENFYFGTADPINGGNLALLISHILSGKDLSGNLAFLTRTEFQGLLEESSRQAKYTVEIINDLEGQKAHHGCTY